MNGTSAMLANRRRIARVGCAIIGLCLVAGVITFWVRVVVPTQRHRQFCERVWADLNSLAKKRPPDVSRKQWHHIVAWTLNAHGNCLTFQKDIPPEEMDRFETELKQRLQGPVNLRTIDWIWDEIVRLTSYGKTYSDSYRPTTPERLREFAETNSSWVGIEVE